MDVYIFNETNSPVCQNHRQKEEHELTLKDVHSDSVDFKKSRLHTVCAIGPMFFLKKVNINDCKKY